MPHTDNPQLTFDVALHPHLDAERHILFGSLKIKGDFRLDRDLNAGDELTVTIAGPDGEVIASGHATTAYPAFKAIKDKGVTIGTERCHTAELTDD
jgi:hypothetical protein